MILNLGAGCLPIAGAINVDRVGPPWCPDVHVRADLDRRPWPFRDGCATRVEARDILEHLDDFLGAMWEIHRILRAGGRLHVRTSHWRTENSFTDPTHRRFCTLRTFAFFDPDHPSGYAAKYPQYAQGRWFHTVRAEESGEELAFVLERRP